MTRSRPTFSVCIPAYNRAVHLAPLLDSILGQQGPEYEIVICEDLSPERSSIGAIVERYVAAHAGRIRYFENPQNLGYDANIRNLVEKSAGDYCFFMGNDDILCPDALQTAADILRRHDNVGFILRSYAWFDSTPDERTGEVRYFGEERVFAPGEEAIRICFRRSGVISGYIVHRDSALAAATERFDGSLYYQMHLTASVLINRCAVSTPEVLVLCRNTEPPDFGHSAKEKGRFVPGRYTPEARLRMVGGALAIVKDLKSTRGIDLVDPITRDYARYFYPYIRDQLNLPLVQYVGLYRGFASMGFWRYPVFHVYTWLCYMLKQRRFDALVKLIRNWLGRSPHFGIST